MAEIFTKVDYSLNAMIDDIELGSIGLPEIQRPFVWKNTKVRDLFDSMYRGFPVGYFLFWQTGDETATKAIGTDKKQLTPNLLIVDGQQRLTSLFAVVKGLAVKRESYKEEKIEIAFNPLDEKFVVSDATTVRDKAFIPNISAIWSKTTTQYNFINGFLNELAASRALTDKERDKISTNIGRLYALLHFPFTVLQLASKVTEEEVSEVFVRINSQGKPLNQADFILTLMSVFWDEGRTQLETFCRDAITPSASGASPFNHFIQPTPAQLLRVSVGLAFRRAQLRHVYSILRGKDLETEQFSPEKRVQQFDLLKAAQAKVLNIQYWHDFLKCLISAGYRGAWMVSSEAAVIFSYILYLLGRTQFNVPESILRKHIAQWFFMSALTGRYTSSPESAMQFDLTRLGGVKDADAFTVALRRVCDDTLTSDYWTIGVPTGLAKASARSPTMFAYFAALNLLDAQVLYSTMKTNELMDPAMLAHKSALERHHLFPKKYLEGIGIKETRETNQIANFALVEWKDNAKISASAPKEYVPEYEAGIKAEVLSRMYYWHGLPNNWQDLPYEAFLQQRREKMSTVIADGYKKLASGEKADPPGPSKPLQVDEIVASGESTDREFKSTLRMNLHTGQTDPRLEMSVLKTIAAFLNAKGGTLVIGVADDGSAVGLGADKFKSEDAMYLHLVNLIKDRIGPHQMMFVHPRFDDFEDERVLVVQCQPSQSPVYVKDGSVEHFYIRTGASTTDLAASLMATYIKQRFG